MREIPLTRGLVALIDDADYERVSAFAWHAVKAKGGKFYAARRLWLNGGRRAVLYLHRFIDDAPPGVEVDHRDGDGLNCRRGNLRRTDHAGNMRNLPPRGASPYKGVYRCKQTNRWHARIEARGKRHHLGRFDDEIAAALAYDGAAVKLHGEFARLNFPDLRGVG